jgi:methyltransferase (TIGR00027 family)
VASDNDDLRNISDTARWVAIYRAIESERPDALFHDPFARRLAGERGERIAETMEFANRNAWSFVARTVVFDRFIEDSLASGADMVVNLAAGLDTRPYRMALPSNLPWIEVDLPDLLAYKIAVLANETPRCRLERVALDLANVAARRELFNRLSQEASRVLVITEGLVVYLSDQEAVSLAEDLAGTPTFHRWALDLVSPALMHRMQKSSGLKNLEQAGAPLKFAPEEGPAFLERHGWTLVEVQSMLHTAARLKRLSFGMRLIALLPDSKGRTPRSPWGGVCLFERTWVRPTSITDSWVSN